jgi:preprotein translocase subunit SecY
MPYITASIILQLPDGVVPRSSASRRRARSAAEDHQYTRYLTVGSPFGQSIGYVFLFRSSRDSRARGVSAS